MKVPEPEILGYHHFGAYIVPSRTSILETLPKVVSIPPKISPKSTTGKLESAFFHVRGASTGHPWISLGALVGIMIGVALWGRGRIRRAKGASGSPGLVSFSWTARRVC
jgi:protein disulfide-isomerase